MILENNRLFRKPPLLGPPLSLLEFDICVCCRSLAPIQWAGLSARATYASCKIVSQEMSAPRCADLITIGDDRHRRREFRKPGCCHWSAHGLWKFAENRGDLLFTALHCSYCSSLIEKTCCNGRVQLTDFLSRRTQRLRSKYTSACYGSCQGCPLVGACLAPPDWTIPGPCNELPERLLWKRHCKVLVWTIWLYSENEHPEKTFKVQNRTLKAEVCDSSYSNW